MSDTSQFARSMALACVREAIADVDQASSRRHAITQGLVGAVVNALNQGVAEEEIAELFRTQDLTFVRAALADSPLTSAEHVNLLQRVLPGGAHDSGEQATRHGRCQADRGRSAKGSAE